MKWEKKVFLVNRKKIFKPVIPGVKHGDRRLKR